VISVLNLDNIPTWIAFLSSLIAGVIVAILVQLFVVPWQKRKILGHGKSTKPVEFTFGDSDNGNSGNWISLYTVKIYENDFTLVYFVPILRQSFS
jgi:hypothetical protein